MKDNKKRKRLIWWLSGGGVALILLIVILVSAFGGNDSPVVEVDKVKKVDKLEAKVTASGEIKPKLYVNLQSEIAGIVTELIVKEGDRVKKGDILLKIDPLYNEQQTRYVRYQMEAAEHDAQNAQNQITETKLNVQTYEANIQSAVASLEQAKANLEQQELSFKRKQQLHEENLISQDEYDLAKATVQAARSNHTSAEAQLNLQKTQLSVSKGRIQQMEVSYQSSMKRVEQCRSQLTQAEDQLKKTILRSPFDGVITTLKVEKGERAVPGTLDNPSATLMTIADLSIIEAEVKVDETDIIHVKLDQSAEVKVDALQDQKLKGHVTEIGNAAINANQAIGGTDTAKDFKVIVQLDKPPEVLRPGLSTTVEITTSVKKDILAIPLQALVIREVEVDDLGNIIRPKPGTKPESAKTSEKKKKTQEKQGVFLVDKAGKVTFTPATTGITGETLIEVVSGIKEGDEIVTGSFKTLRTLKDGDTVIKKKASALKDKEKAKEE